MNQNATPIPQQPEPKTRAFYLDSLAKLDDAKVPYVVGGGYAMTYYTGIVRHTKDLDLFIHRRDRDRALDVLEAAGYQREITWPHFLAKAIAEGAFVDLLYNSGNGLSPVDDAYFEHAVHGEVLGRAVPVCPAEEMIWTKAFVQDRDRFDGADVNHLVLHRGRQFDWERLLGRFKGHERVLLAHLVLYGYAFPSERENVPAWVMDRLIGSLEAETPAEGQVCQGTFLAQKPYLPDVGNCGPFHDARLQPPGPLKIEDIGSLTPEAVAILTAA